MINVAIFVSGNGSNCENLIRHFQNHNKYKIALVLSNKSDAYALERARRLDVATAVMTKAQLNNPKEILPLLALYGIRFIVLAGFLPMIPDFLIEAFHNRIINLHPALLPKYGGKGMWGHYVHEAIKNAGEKVTGMTVHFVSSVCDGGQIIVQHKCEISPDDTADSIAEKEHNLEMTFFPNDLEQILEKIFG